MKDTKPEIIKLHLVGRFFIYCIAYKEAYLYPAVETWEGVVEFFNKEWQDGLDLDLFAYTVVDEGP